MVASREIKRGEGESNGRNMRGNGKKKKHKRVKVRGILSVEREYVWERNV